MDKYASLVEYFRQCPQLADLIGIAGTEEADNTIILPQGASPAVQYQEKVDQYGNYECDIEPYPSVYEDFQINCYRFYNPRDPKPPALNGNILTYEEVTQICGWVREQDESQSFPMIGENIVAIECNPFVPQIRFADEKNGIVCYYITVRIRYVNRRERRSVFYAPED